MLWKQDPYLSPTEQCFIFSKIIKKKKANEILLR